MPLHLLGATHMSAPCNNRLRACRKKTPAQLTEMATLLEYESSSSLSRYEKGKQEPPLQVIIDYMVAFNCTLRDIFPQQFCDSHKRFREHLPKVLEALHATRADKYREDRITLFTEILKHIQETPLPDPHATLLSLYPNGQGCGFAVFENQQHLYDIGILRPVTFDQKKILRSVTELIDIYQPKSIVLRGSSTKHTSMSKRVQSMLRKLQRIANKQDIPVSAISAVQVGAAFACFGASNQHDRTQKLREWFPEVRYRKPLERKKYTSKDPRQYAYDALAQGVTYHFLND